MLNFSHAPSTHLAHQAAIFITGVSSGIGKALALQLLQEGYWVLGTVRRPSDGRYLDAAGGKSLVLDVTDLRGIKRVSQKVRSMLGSKPLFALVNNTGLSTCVSWEDMTSEELRHEMDVNFFGAVAITKALLPLVRSSHGRIVVISSTAVRLPLAFMGAYCASKCALEAFAITLRQELFREKIPVICVQPGPVQTKIFQKSRHNLKMAHAHAVQCGTYCRFIQRNVELESKALKPEILAKRLAHILQKPHPPFRAVISRDAWFNYLVPRLPQHWIDFIVNQYLFPKKR